MSSNVFDVGSALLKMSGVLKLVPLSDTELGVWNPTVQGAGLSV